jgi:hypothetical protein
VSHSFGYIPKSGIAGSYGRSVFSFLFFIYLFIFYCFIIHMCIQGLGHFSPLPPPPPLPPTPPPPSPPHPSIPSRNYFALISDFVEERV